MKIKSARNKSFTLIILLTHLGFMSCMVRDDRVLIREYLSPEKDQKIALFSRVSGSSKSVHFAITQPDINIDDILIENTEAFTIQKNMILQDFKAYWFEGKTPVFVYPSEVLDHTNKSIHKTASSILVKTLKCRNYSDSHYQVFDEWKARIAFEERVKSQREPAQERLLKFLPHKNWVKLLVQESDSYIYSHNYIPIDCIKINPQQNSISYSGNLEAGGYWVTLNIHKHLGGNKYLCSTALAKENINVEIIYSDSLLNIRVLDPTFKKTFDSATSTINGTFVPLDSIRNYHFISTSYNSISDRRK